MLVNQRAVLDACVLYPAPLRDLPLSCAAEGSFEPKWTADIQGEWVRNLLINRPDLKEKQLRRTVIAMDAAFPAAEVKNHRSLIAEITLPDPNDRHVLAAAIRAEAAFIVTFNLKDFPYTSTQVYKAVAVHPDTFLTHLFRQNPAKVARAFEKQVKRLSHPPKSPEQVLAALEVCGLKEIVKVLKQP
jgi:predicted nucleic acid-binding protein